MLSVARYITRPGETVGYHGTSAAAAQIILSTQEFIPGDRKWDWLGQGVYFWERGENRARQWAEYIHGNVDQAVIMANIQFGNCLDFFDTGPLELFEEGLVRMGEEYVAAGIPMPENRGGRKDLDNAVFDYIIRHSDVPVDSLRAPFPEGEPVVSGSALSGLGQVQICVRNDNCITNISLVEVRRVRDIRSGVETAND